MRRSWGRPALRGIITAGALALASVGCAPKKRPPSVLEEPKLADGPGREAFQSQCLLCHSSRYVTNQPRLTRTAWTAEVEKMKNAFGAPIAPETQGVLIDYLVLVNGTDD